MKTQPFSTKLILFIFLHLPVIAISQVSELTNTPATAGDYLGWDNSSTQALTIKNEANQPINFHTNTGVGGTGNIRMTITGAGRVGIGTIAPSNPFSATLIQYSTGTASQATTTITGTGTTFTTAMVGSQFVFADGTSAGTITAFNSTTSLTVSTSQTVASQAYQISFTGLQVAATGNVGIGTTTPAHRLDVTGDINIATDQVYRINGVIMLGDKSFASPRNIFVGQLAGNNIQAAGTTNTRGNTCVGANTGQSLTANSSDAIYNTLIGAVAGNDMTTGGFNTIVGHAAGEHLTQGINNLFAGSYAGHDLTTSANNNSNVILGANAGSTATPVITTATALTLVGFNAEATNNLTNACAIGANAYVTASNALILGSINGTNGATANTNVGIGTTAPTSRLHVVNNAENITGYFDCTRAAMTDIIKAVYNQTSTGSIDGIDVSLTSSASSGTYTNAGVRSSVACSSTNHTNIGVYGYGTGDGNTKNYGGYFEGLSNAVAATTNYGVYAKATGGVNNYGIYAVATGTQSVTNCAGYFSGDAHSSTGFYGPSDETLKQNIQPFTNGLSILAQLNPKSFEFRTSEYPQMNLPENTSYGLIAQELQSVIPSLVDSFVHPVELDSNGIQLSPEVSFIGVNYAGLVPFLIAAIKEQQLQIQDLNNRITSCCGPGIQEFQVPDNGNNQPSTINHQQLASVARDLPVLSQNQPNPFSEKTLIRFYIPKSTKDAAIKVFDNTGSVYRLFSITGEGPGTIELEANSLAAGNYYYSLLIGGNVIDTKTMVITK